VDTVITNECRQVIENKSMGYHQNNVTITKEFSKNLTRFKFLGMDVTN
jgi:hypothetical protein